MVYPEIHHNYQKLRLNWATLNLSHLRYETLATLALAFLYNLDTKEPVEQQCQIKLFGQESLGTFLILGFCLENSGCFSMISMYINMVSERKLRKAVLFYRSVKQFTFAVLHSK